MRNNSERSSNHRYDNFPKGTLAKFGASAERLAEYEKGGVEYYGDDLEQDDIDVAGAVEDGANSPDDRLTYMIGSKVLGFRNLLPKSNKVNNRHFLNFEEFLRGGKEITRGDYPDYYYDWQIDCLEKIKDKKHVFLTSPTGTGKTLVYIDWAKHMKGAAERETGQKHTIYITAPRVELAKQYYAELLNEGCNVGLETGEEKIILDDADFICCTQGIYTNKYINDKNGIYVSDEVQEASEDPNYARAMVDAYVFSHAYCTLACSATVGDVDQTADYLGDLTDAECYAYENHERITELEMRSKIGSESIRDALVVSFSAKNCKRVAETLFKIRRDGIKTTYRYRYNDEDDDDYDDDYGDYGYSRSRRAEEVEEQIRVVPACRYDEALTKEIEALAEELNIDNSDLIRWAKYGVATYYSDMLKKEKEFVKQALGRRLIDTIAATDAVAVGVNLPVQMTVFAQLAKYKDGPISKNAFDQLSGRAGRPGYFDKGYIYYCDEFYWEDRNGRHHKIERRDYDTGELFEKYRTQKNEELSIRLAPKYANLFRGDRSIDEEVSYISRYSNEEVDEDEIRRACEEAVNCDGVVFRRIIDEIIKINNGTHYSDRDDDIDDFCDFYLGVNRKKYTIRYDLENKTVKYGEVWDDGYFLKAGSYSLGGSEKIFKEAERRVTEKCNVSSLDQFDHDLRQLLAKCYDLRYDPETNKDFASYVLAGDSDKFNEMIRETSSLRTLRNLRSYLMHLPAECRGGFIDSIFRIERKMDEMDETALSEKAGRISEDEISDSLRSIVRNDVTISAIADKVYDEDSYTLSSEEVELLFSDVAASDVGIYDRGGLKRYIEQVRKNVSLKALIDSGADPSVYMNLLDTQSVYGKEKDPVYCFEYLLRHDYMNDDMFRSFAYGRYVYDDREWLSLEVLKNNISQALDAGIEMGSLLRYAGFKEYESPVQIDILAPYLARTDNKKVLFNDHKIAEMSTVVRAAEVLGTNLDGLANIRAFDKVFVRENLRKLVEMGCSPNSLIGYCIDFWTEGAGYGKHEYYRLDGRRCRELLELGADSVKLVEHADQEWMRENSDILLERGMIVKDGDRYRPVTSKNVP